MKNKVLTLSLLFISLIACSSDEKPKEQEEEQQKIPAKMEPTSEWPNLLLGKWEFIEQCESDPYEGGYICDTPSNYYYKFSNDSIIKTNRFENNNTELEGIFFINENNIKMEFPSINHSFSIKIHFLNTKKLILVSAGDDSSLYSVYKKS